MEDQGNVFQCVALVLAFISQVFTSYEVLRIEPNSDLGSLVSDSLLVIIHNNILIYYCSDL